MRTSATDLKRNLTFTFSHFADALSKATYNWGIHKAINLEAANRQREVPITPSLRHCSNKYKLAREEVKEKDEDLEKGKVFLILFFYDEVK